MVLMIDGLSSLYIFNTEDIKRRWKDGISLIYKLKQKLNISYTIWI